MWQCVARDCVCCRIGVLLMCGVDQAAGIDRGVVPVGGVGVAVAVLRVAECRCEINKSYLITSNVVSDI